MRKFRVQITETVTYTREFPESDLAWLLKQDIEGVLAGDIEDLWVTNIESDMTVTGRLEKAVRLPEFADYSIPEFHIEEI